MLVPANSRFPIIMIRYFLRNNYGFLHLASIKSYPCPAQTTGMNHHDTGLPPPHLDGHPAGYSIFTPNGS